MKLSKYIMPILYRFVKYFSQNKSSQFPPEKNPVPFSNYIETILS